MEITLGKVFFLEMLDSICASFFSFSFFFFFFFESWIGERGEFKLDFSNKENQIMSLNYKTFDIYIMCIFKLK